MSVFSLLDLQLSVGKKLVLDGCDSVANVIYRECVSFMHLVDAIVKKISARIAARLVRASCERVENKVFGGSG